MDAITINFKYKLGDKVWVLTYDRVIEVTITERHYQYSEKFNSADNKSYGNYTVSESSGSRVHDSGIIVIMRFDDSKLFTTKAELLATL